MVGREVSQSSILGRNTGAGVGCLVYKVHSEPESDFLLSSLLRPEQRQVCDRPLGEGMGKKVEGLGRAGVEQKRAGLGSKPLAPNRTLNHSSAFAS